MNLERPIIPSKSEIAKTASTPTSKSKRSSASFSALHYNNNSHQFHMDSPSSPSPRRLPLRINDMLRESTASYSDTDRGNEPEKESSDSSLKSKSTRQNALANRGKPNIADANDTKVKTKASVQTGDVSTQKQAASYNSDSNLANDDLILAVTALGKMKSDSQSSLRSPSPPAPQLTASRNMPKPPTIFDKMISHPIISNSINYVLEKTINNSATNIPAPNSLPVRNSASTGGLINDDSNNKKRRRSPTVENEPNQKDVPYTGVNKRFKPRNLQIPESHFMTNTNLRQRVAITSAMSAQKSLEELKHLSTLNFNIESRKKLTMLIHFLRLGNSQLSERIDKLIQSVDAKREKIGAKSTASDGQSNAESDLSIQEIKADIVTTVKKIVNVVSKVSAQSLSEPARSNVREALLKLPTNWATMLNNESVFSLGIHEEDDEEEEEEDEEEEDEDEEDDGNDVNYDNHALAENDDKGLHQNNKNGGDAQGVSSEENIPTMTVNNKTIFKRTRKPSISQRLITSLLRYRKTKGDKIDKNKSKLRKWFREKIRDQLMHDSSGKVLILAQESLDMINKIITFCNESLDKADHWNTDKQKHHQFELLKRLQNMNSLSPSVEKVETIVVKDSRVDCSQDAVDSPKEDKPVTRP